MPPPGKEARRARLPEPNTMLIHLALRLRRWLRYRPERRYMRGRLR